MKREIVVSSELHSVGYDDSDNVLEVAFRTGGVYRYFGVPRTLFVSLINAPSKGQFFNKQIKPAFFCLRIK